MGSMLRDIVVLSRTLKSLAAIHRVFSYRATLTSSAPVIPALQKDAPILAGNQIPTRCSTLWNPLNIFTCPSTYQHALIILNRPLHWKQNLLINVWEKATTRVTVDGGTNRWITFLGSHGEAMVNGKSSEFLPDLITGDMDSILPDTLNMLRQIGANIVNTPDQNETDYTKAIIQLGIYTKSKGINLDGIYVFSQTSGRLDHIIANINTLFKSDKYVNDVQVIQVSSNSMTWLLRPGTHRILIPASLIKLNSWCALMPIGCRVNSITTTGLKWNLESASLEFGGMVSTSNTYSDSPEVTVTTDSPVLWSMDIEPLMENMNFGSQRSS